MPATQNNRRRVGMSARTIEVECQYLPIQAIWDDGGGRQS